MLCNESYVWQYVTADRKEWTQNTTTAKSILSKPNQSYQCNCLFTNTTCQWFNLCKFLFLCKCCSFLLFYFLLQTSERLNADFDVKLVTLDYLSSELHQHQRYYDNHLHHSPTSSAMLSVILFLQSLFIPSGAIKTSRTFARHYAQ